MFLKRTTTLSTTTISKIIERAVHGQIIAFLSDKHILYNYESGFGPNQSTNLCLSFLRDNF